MENLSENEKIVLNHLEDQNLTTFEAVTELHIMNVQDVIMRLRNKNYNIDKVWKTSAKKKRFATYTLISNQK